MSLSLAPPPPAPLMFAHCPLSPPLAVRVPYPYLASVVSRALQLTPGTINVRSPCPQYFYNYMLSVRAGEEPAASR